METLYELGQNYLELEQMINNEEVSEKDLQDTFEAIEDAVSVKIDNIGGMLARARESKTACEREIERLKALKEFYENRENRLKNLTLTYLQTTDKKKVEGSIFRAVRVMNAPKVNILHEASIPEQFCKTKQTIVIDKKAIKAAIESGEEVSGAELIRTERVDFK